MANVAYHTKDESLLKACDRLWNNITKKQMYITGGIGSTAIGEAFTIDYDLPNDTVYSETCASVGLIFFAQAMLKNCQDSKYADIMERALYNGVIAGMSLDGKRFFYVNPLEVNPEYAQKVVGFEHIRAQRPNWFGCACCPPNVVRLITSLSQYAFIETDDIIYSNLLVRENLSKVAIEKDPFVYCFEGADNIDLQQLEVAKDAQITEELRDDPILNTVPVLVVDGYRMETVSDLYTYQKPSKTPSKLTAIPYYMWGNRGEHRMKVWMGES